MKAALRRLGRGAKFAFDSAAGMLVALLLRAVRHFDRIRTSNLFAAFLRTVGPWLPEHRIGRANLAAAFPEKSPAEIERILIGVWENLGRVALEFAHIDTLTEGDPYRRKHIDYDEANIERFLRLRDDGKPALV